MTGETTAAGLYVHVPFCVRKCPYCDFYSTADATLQKAYLKALGLEMRRCCFEPSNCDTIYLGGGTPSILPEEAINGMMAAIADTFKIQADAEVTIEVNPGTVGRSDMRAYRRAGINRMNIGIQSFNRGHLDFLGRIHTTEDAYAAFRAARRAGFENVGIDLIYGLPGQTKASWQTELETALSLQPEHLSCYMLTYESGTPMDQARRKGRITPLAEDVCAELLTVTRQFLAAHDYAQYEISNFARVKHGRPDAYRSRHNLKYWNKIPYLGFGPSAHSYVPPVRWWNLKQVAGYVSRLNEKKFPIAGHEILSREQQMMEALYLGLRQTAGIEMAAFEKAFAVDFCEYYAKPLAEMVAEGVLKRNGKRCALTLKGMPLLDSVVARLV